MKCIFIKQDNIQCRANALSNSKYCFSHDPDKKAEKAMAVKKGGLASKRVLLNFNEDVVLDNAKDAKVFISKVINGVWKGKIPATPTANSLGFLVRCFLDAHDKADVEMRIEKIEKKIEANK